MKERISTASLILRYTDEWQGAILEDDYNDALTVVHGLVKKTTRADSATMGFAAGLYYGKRRERDRRRMKAKKKAR